MKIKGKFLLLFVFCTVFFNALSRETAVFQEGTSRTLGSEFANADIFNKTFDVNRIVPVLSYIRAEAFVKIAKVIVQRNDIKDIFSNLDESKFKMEVRRQYFLYTKGEVLDSVEISFSVLELFRTGMLDDKVNAASKTGELDLSGFRISSLYGLQEVLEKVTRNITKLDLSRNLLAVISSSDFLHGFSRVTYLDLSYNRIAILQDKSFDELQAVKFIDLGHNQLADIPPLFFSTLTQLKKLDLSDNQLKIEPVLGIDIEELNLSDNFI